MITEEPICSVCDHAVLPGIACDGMQNECPADKKSIQQPREGNGYAATVERVTGEIEYDCVKGLD